MNDLVTFMASIAVFTLLVWAVLIGAFFVVPVALLLFVGYLIYNYYQRRMAKSDIERRTQRLYDEAQKLSPKSKENYLEAMREVFDDPVILEVAGELYELEGFETPGEPPALADTVEGGRYRDRLMKYIEANKDPQRFLRWSREVGRITHKYAMKHGGLFQTRVQMNGGEVDRLIREFFKEDDFFLEVCRELDERYKQAGVFPSEYTGDDVAEVFLGDTPLRHLSYRWQAVDLQDRAEHTMIMGQSGSGKTNLLQWIIANDLKQDCCVVVIDSQAQLIDALTKVDIPKNDVTWISPTHQLGINLFDVRYEEMADDEAMVNNTINLLTYAMEGLMPAELTEFQRNLFEYAAQVIITRPGANIFDFIDFLNDPLSFAEDIDRADEVVQDFFYKDFKTDNLYKKTAQEVIRRLRGMVRNKTFRRIFSARENPINMFEELDQAKLFLVDTSKKHLGDASGFFGRMFIAMILQAAYQRVEAGRTGRPVYLVIDEAHEYFDSKLADMLQQARKANVCVTLGFQELAQLNKGKTNLTSAVQVNTRTKIVSVSTRAEAAVMAGNMRTTPDFLLDLQKYHFGFFHQSIGTVDVTAPKDALSRLSQRDDLDEMREEMERQYGPDEPVSEIEEEFSDNVAHEEQEAFDGQEVPEETADNLPATQEEVHGGQFDESPPDVIHLHGEIIPPKRLPMRPDDDDDIKPSDKL